MKKTVKILLSAVICLTFMLSFSLSALAATATLKLGYSGTLNPGNTITVNITVECSADLYSYDAIVQYDTSYLQLVTTSDGITSAAGSFVVNPTSKTGAKTLTATAQFKLLKAGSTTVRVLEGAGGDGTNQGVSVAAKSLSLSITAPQKSGDATLKSISISAGTLSPSFSPNVTEYKVTVPYSVTYFSIDGYATHSGAKVTYKDGPGPKIEVGTTVRVITVTAENGAQKKYNIAVTRLADTASTSSSTSSADTSSTTSAVEPEENKLETSVNGNKMTVAETIPDDVSVSGFEKGEYNFNSIDVPALLSGDNSVVLLYLLSEEGKGELYFYNSSTDIFELPCIVNGAKQFTIIPVTALKRDQLLIDTENVFNLSTVTIGEQQVEAYVYKDDALSDFAIVCAINEAGEKGFYRYDIKEGTLQRYVAEYRTEVDADAKVAATMNTDAIVVLVCAGVCLAAIIAIIIIWAARRRYYDEEEFEEEFDDAEPLFVKETDFDQNDEAENFADEENEPETDEKDGEKEDDEE